MIERIGLPIVLDIGNRSDGGREGMFQADGYTQFNSRITLSLPLSYILTSMLLMH